MLFVNAKDHLALTELRRAASEAAALRQLRRHDAATRSPLTQQPLGHGKRPLAAQKNSTHRSECCFVSANNRLALGRRAAARSVGG